MKSRTKQLYELAIQSTMDYHKANLRATQKELDNFCAETFANLIIEESHQVIVVGGVDGLDDVMKHFEIE